MPTSTTIGGLQRDRVDRRCRPGRYLLGLTQRRHLVRPAGHPVQPAGRQRRPARARHRRVRLRGARRAVPGRPRQDDPAGGLMRAGPTPELVAGALGPAVAGDPYMADAVSTPPTRGRPANGSRPATPTTRRPPTRRRRARHHPVRRRPVPRTGRRPTATRRSKIWPGLRRPAGRWVRSTGCRASAKPGSTPSPTMVVPLGRRRSHRRAVYR